MKQLAKKIVEVMHDCNYVEKNGKNTFHGYQYATSADVLAKVNAALVKYGIASMASPQLLDMTDVTTAKGHTEKLATIQMTITLVDTDTGERCQIMGIGSGQDSGDKAVMKAETAAIKYAYLLSLAISTGDDPEADERTDLLVTLERGKKVEEKATVSNLARSIPSADECVCVDCGAKISFKVSEYAKKKYGKALCMRC